MNAGILGGPIAQQQSLFAGRIDTFHRANQSPMGVPSGGGSAWVTPTAGSAWSIVSNTANLTTVAAGDNYATLSDGHADVVVSAVVQNNAGSNLDVGLVARFLDVNNLILGRFAYNAGFAQYEAQIYKVVAGTSTLIANTGLGGSTGTVAPWTMTLSLAGAAATMLIVDHLGTTTKTTTVGSGVPSTGGTDVGIWLNGGASDNGSIFQSFQATP